MEPNVGRRETLTSNEYADICEVYRERNKGN